MFVAEIITTKSNKKKLTDLHSYRTTFHPLSDKTLFPQITWQYLELGLVAGLGRPHIFHQTAVEACVGL